MREQDDMFERASREAVARMMDERRAMAAAGSEAERALEARRAASVKEHMLQTSDRMIVAEYEAAGLPAPEAGRMMVSLGLMRKLGWEIAGRVLVAPSPESPRRRTTRTNEMGS